MSFDHFADEIAFREQTERQASMPGVMSKELEAVAGRHVERPAEAAEYTGGSVSYYKAPVAAPLSGGAPYVAECNDIIEALGMTYAEGNAFKAIWRRCAARTLGMKKRGYTDGLYDAEKVEFFGSRMVAQERGRQGGSE